MIIKNGNVFQEDGNYKVTDLYIENGRLVASEEEVTDKTELDASGLKAQTKALPAGIDERTPYRLQPMRNLYGLSRNLS